MKEKKQKNSNRIFQVIMVVSVCLVMGITALGAGYLRLSDRQNVSDSQIKQRKPTLTKTAGAVMVEKKESENTTFANDNKLPIRIVEVIPHPACSVFPYLIDWGSKEEYDKNTVIGYEGFRYLTTNNGNIGTKQFVSHSLKGMTSDTLPEKEYDNLIQKGNAPWNLGWWRETEADNIVQASGYFEYVGEGKGLYSINLKEIVENTSADNGIRYRVQAMARKYSESKKGEWEVKDARYYWAKDFDPNAVSYPTGDIKQKTDYNYDLKFSAGNDGTGNADYKVAKVSAKATEQTAGSISYDYTARLVAGKEWTGGYVYQKQGNYKVSGYNSVLVKDTASENDLKDKYVRVSNKEKADGVSGLDEGYFQLCNPAEVSEGNVVYSLTFSYAVGNDGSYVLNPAIVENAIKYDTRGEILQDIIFEYAGKNTGNYDVAFMYASSDAASPYQGVKYSCSLLEVSDGDGRYALTSTEPDESKLYESVGAEKGDYSKVVTRIDAAGIDYKTYNSNPPWSAPSPVDGYYDWGTVPGMRMGCNKDGGEYGAWVFHTVTSEKENGITKIEALEGGKIPSDNRIFVYNQNRHYRYYAQNGFVNNEWFKLLFYLGNADGTGGLALKDYQEGKLTAAEIKEKYKKNIEEFDRTYKVEIIQRTPGELSVSDVEKADLLFFAECISLPGMSKDRWNEIAAKSTKIIPTYDANVRYDSDLKPETLMAIYKNCLYDQTTAIMFGCFANEAQGLGGYVSNRESIDKNLGKMFMLTNLFEDPRYFAYFIEGYSEKNQDYSTIGASNGYVTAYNQGYKGGNTYNLGSKRIKWNPNDPDAGKDISPIITDVWQPLYFRVVELKESEVGELYDSGEYGSDENGGKYDGKYGYQYEFNAATVHFSNKDVETGVWYLPGSIRDPFWDPGKTANIWKILHNKKSKQASEPVVIVTNADVEGEDNMGNIMPVYYFYVDDYSLSGTSRDDFDVKFKVNWKPETVTKVNALQSLVMTKSDGTVVYNVPQPAYGTEYTCNVATDFMKDGALNNAVTSKEYLVTATDSAGHTDSVIVRFIVREAFMLN